MNKYVRYLTALLCLALSGHYLMGQSQLGDNLSWTTAPNGNSLLQRTVLQAVAMSADGSRMVVGEPDQSFLGPDFDLLVEQPFWQRTGRVRVFEQQNGTWTLLGDPLYGTEVGDKFGTSVAMSADGQRIAVGAPRDDFGQDAILGYAAVYEWNSTEMAWEQLGFQQSGENFGDAFGTSVSLSDDGEVLAVGVPQTGPTGGTGTFEAYDWDGSSWVERNQNIPFAQAGQQTGTSVSLSASGDTIAVGSPGFTQSGDGGAVNTFAWTGFSWTVLTGRTGDAVGFGTSVSLSDDGLRVAVGSPQDQSNESQPGKIYAYELSGGALQPLGDTIEGPTEIGQVVSLSGDGTRIAGAPGSRGSISAVFTLDNGAWTNSGPQSFAGDNIYGARNAIALSNDGDRVAVVSQFGSFASNDTVGADRAVVYELGDTTATAVGDTVLCQGEGPLVGYAVATSADGNTVAVSAPYSGLGGGVRVYDLTNGAWELRGSMFTDNFSNDDNAFGTSLALSADGNRAVVGSPLSGSDSLGSDVGLVEVFDWDGSFWRLSHTIVGAEEGDLEGLSVALSADGNRVAVGAPEAELFDGRVRVFEFGLTDSTWSQLGSDLTGGFTLAGTDVALSGDGNRLALGVSDSAVSIFEWDGSAWTQLGEGLIDTAEVDFGTKVSLSQDGSRVAIAAPIGDLVEVYEWDGSAWTQLGNSLVGPFDSGFGYGLSLSDDGNRMAVGAPLAADSAGEVYLYEWSGTNWFQQGDAFSGGSPGTTAGFSVALAGNGERFIHGAVRAGTDLLAALGLAQAFDVAAITAVHQLEQQTITVYPNPTTGLVQIEGGLPEQVRVMDLQGRVLRTLPAFTTSVDLSDFPAGLYLLDMAIGSERITQKLIKR